MGATVYLDDVVLNIEDAAARARVPESTIRRWCESGLRHLNTASNGNAAGPKGTVILLSNLLKYVDEKSVALVPGKGGGMTVAATRGKPGRPKAGPAPAAGDDFMNDLAPKGRGA